MPKMNLPYTLKRMKLADLKPHPKQKKTRQITDEALTGLKGSLDRFGVLEEIIVNAKTGHVLSGHQRWKILAAENGTKAIPVKVVNVSKNEEDAIFWTLNNPAISGEYTPEAKVELQEIEVDLGELYVDVGLDMLEVSLPHRDDLDRDDAADPTDPVPDKNANILVRLSFNPGMWLGKREEIIGITEKMKSTYECRVVIDE